MDWKKLIGDALQRKAAIEQQRAAYRAEQVSIADSIGDNESFSEEQRGRIDELTAMRSTEDARITEIDAEIERYRSEQAADELEARAARESNPGAALPPGGAARTNAREGTYSARKNKQEGVSFFSDLYRSQMGMAGPEVQARLSAHTLEARELGNLSERAIGTGNLGGLVPPQYLVEEAAAIARAGRPTANVVRRLPLPAQGMSLVIPRGTTGTTAAVQATQNSNVSNTDAAITDLIIPVVTIAGQQDVSRQSLERGEGVDSLIFADLAGAYAVSLDQQVLSGTGSSGQMQGILTTAGIPTMVAFTAAVTATTFWKKLAGAINAVQTGRFIAPTGIVMHPRRWAYLTGEVDTAGRPLVVPNPNGPSNAQGVYNEPIDVPASVPVGWIQGLPVFTDANIPTSVGTGPEDQVIVARLEDLLLWEDGDGSPQQLRFEQTTGGSLTVKLIAYGYAAFTAGRFPTATAIIGGNAASGFGLIAPTF